MLEENENSSIGVILFTNKQANFIKKMIYKEGNYPRIIKALESYDANSLFIKSLDQVQGEERDVIIFGITYGNSMTGYGYLSKRYGENRINVAITRAKNKMIIIKSHKHNEYRRIMNSITGSRGPEILFDFLEYAENVSNGKYKTDNQVTSLNSQKSLFENNLEKMNVKILKTILVNNKEVFIDDKNIAFYLIDETSLKNAREEI
jgi:hypothetical protein